jgi:hypothetical protein
MVSRNCCIVDLIPVIDLVSLGINVFEREGRHFQESSYTQSRIKQKLTWGLWEKVRKIAGRIRIFVHPQEEWRTPRV